MGKCDRSKGLSIIASNKQKWVGRGQGDIEGSNIMPRVVGEI